MASGGWEREWAYLLARAETPRVARLGYWPSRRRPTVAETSEPSAALRVTVEDLLTGDVQTAEIPEGEYLLLTTRPCHVASTQAYPSKGTHVITIKGRTAP